ncbi:MAG: type II secretion system F family protein [Elusimicrobia bacterium]|nr:type II secretion system F family protein [Elusimicrobiota bacterium]
MPSYRYKAMDRNGQQVTGSSSAASLDDLTAILKTQQLFLIEGKEEKKDADKAYASAESAVEGVAKSDDSASLKTVALFTTELAIMVRTALPILEALNTLASQQQDAAFKLVLLEVAKSVREGKPLSAAFARYPKIFDEIYVGLLAVGEAGGTMGSMLQRIERYLEFRLELKAKIRSALLYPSIVVLTAFCVVVFLVLFILPTFMEIFSQLEVPLPWSTRLLLFLSAHFRTWWTFYLPGLFFAWLFLTNWISELAHRKKLEALLLELPVLGPLVTAVVLTRVLTTLSALMTSGVPILKSLSLARAAAGNAVFDDLFGAVYRDASEGKGLASALAASPYFPQSVTHMIANAERTGNLPEVLDEVAAHYGKEVDVTLKDLFTVLEPSFVVFLGLMVGGIAVSVLLPIFELAGAIQ